MLRRGKQEGLVDEKPVNPDRPPLRGGNSLLASARRRGGHDHDGPARNTTCVFAPRSDTARPSQRARSPSESYTIVVLRQMALARRCGKNS